MKKRTLLGLSIFTISPITYGMEKKTDAPVAGTPSSIIVVAPEARARSSSLPHHRHSHSSTSSQEVPTAELKQEDSKAPSIVSFLGHLGHHTAHTPKIPQPQHEHPAGIAIQPTAGHPAANAETTKQPKPTLWANIKNASPTDWARIVISAFWNMIWGKRPEIMHHTYHKHHQDNHKIDNFIEALNHQGRLVRNAYKYQVKRSSSLATVAAAITAAVAYPSYGASASTIALGAGAGLATGAISWFYHGRRAQLNEIAERHKAVVLHAIRADVTDLEAAAAYNQVVRAGYWHSLFKFLPVGIADMSSIRDEVQDNARILERDRLRTELTHTVVPQAANPNPQSTNP